MRLDDAPFFGSAARPRSPTPLCLLLHPESARLPPHRIPRKTHIGPSLERRPLTPLEQQTRDRNTDRHPGPRDSDSPFVLEQPWLLRAPLSSPARRCWRSAASWRPPAPMSASTATHAARNPATPRRCVLSPLSLSLPWCCCKGGTAVAGDTKQWQRQPSHSPAFFHPPPHHHHQQTDLHHRTLLARRRPLRRRLQQPSAAAAATPLQQQRRLRCLHHHQPLQRSHLPDHLLLHWRPVPLHVDVRCSGAAQAPDAAAAHAAAADASPPLADAAAADAADACSAAQRRLPSHAALRSLLQRPVRAGRHRRMPAQHLLPGVQLRRVPRAVRASGRRRDGRGRCCCCCRCRQGCGRAAARGHRGRACGQGSGGGQQGGGKEAVIAVTMMMTMMP